MSDAVRILIGDVREGLRSLPERSVHCVVTSPPYWGLRDYGVDGQIGLEATPEAFVETMVEVFREVRRVMRDDATLWLNLGDSYFGTGKGPTPPTGMHGSADVPVQVKGVYSHDLLKQKDLCMVPWRVALALQADGWWLRSIIAWHKRSPMPESCTDRPTSSWEPIFLLTKRERYFYDAEAVKEKSMTKDTRTPYGSDGAWAMDGRNKWEEGKGGQRIGADPNTRNMRNVWTLSSEPYSEAHFATFPSEIPRRAIKAGTSEKGCCPHCGTPWERVVERKGGTIGKSWHSHKNDLQQGASQDGAARVAAMTDGTYEVRTIGWKPGCACPDHQPVPCVVLDPFLGSGTTIAAARQLGRHGVGCELNPDYAELARVRIGKAEKPHTFVDTREPEEGGLFK